VSAEETSPVAEEITPPSDLPEADAAPAQEADTMAAELAAARKEAQEYKEGWLRERADFANYKKRVDNQMKDLREAAAVESLMSLLPIIDDFERAMANVPAEWKEHPWLNGVGGIQRKFLRLLEEKGVTSLDPAGKPFDPSQHEAVVMEDSETVESGHVIETLQKGYVRGERILRPALVKVAK
jgi:molecular chaperone GrpE